MQSICYTHALIKSEVWMLSLLWLHRHITICKKFHTRWLFWKLDLHFKPLRLLVFIYSCFSVCHKNSSGLKAGFVSRTSWEHHVPPPLPSNVITFSELQQRLMALGSGDTHLVHLCPCMSQTLESWSRVAERVTAVWITSLSGETGELQQGPQRRTPTILLQICQVLQRGSLLSWLQAPSLSLAKKGDFFLRSLIELSPILFQYNIFSTHFVQNANSIHKPQRNTEED